MHPDDARALDVADLGDVGAALLDLEASDVDMHDPPPAIWGRIAAASASESVRRAPARAAAPSIIVEYAIDDRDVVVGVGGQWAEFATENGAAELVAPSVDRTLWSYFDQDEVRELWQMVVAHVRAGRGTARLPFRCDAPGARRWFEMTVAPLSGDGVRFRSEMVFEQAREPVALLDTAAVRDSAVEPITVCTWCGRGAHGADWVEIDELLRAERLLERAALPAITWSICAACRDDMAAELLVAGGIADVST